MRIARSQNGAELTVERAASLAAPGAAHPPGFNSSASNVETIGAQRLPPMLLDAEQGTRLRVVAGLQRFVGNAQMSRLIGAERTAAIARTGNPLDRGFTAQRQTGDDEWTSSSGSDWSSGGTSSRSDWSSGEDAAPGSSGSDWSSGEGAAPGSPGSAWESGDVASPENGPGADWESKPDGDGPGFEDFDVPRPVGGETGDRTTQGKSVVDITEPHGHLGKIFFPTDVSDLDDDDMVQLQTLIDGYLPKLNASQRPIAFSFVGFADHRASERHNQPLSRQRAESVMTFVRDRFFGHKNFTEVTLGLGEEPNSTRAGSTAQQLIPFRRVDIFAEPVDTPKPPEKKPGPPNLRKTSLIWRAKLFDQVSAGEVFGVDTFKVEIHDLTNRIGQRFRYKGAGLTVGSIGCVSEGTSFKDFTTTSPIAMPEFEGFARHTGGAISVSAGIGVDIVHWLGPFQRGVADSVQIEYREVFGSGENACLGAGTSIGTLEPLGGPFAIVI